MTIRAVLFDLDGTLIDSLDDLSEAVNRMRAAFSKPGLDRLEVRTMIGKGARNLVQQALLSEDPAEIDRGLAIFIEYNREHIADRTVLYPGIVQLLKGLAARGIPMAVISNKVEALTRLILERLAVDRYFPVVCGGDTFSEMKPSPLPLLAVCQRLGVAPEEAVMVGDSINDIQAGRSAGIRTIGCDWGFGYADELAQADLTVSSSEQLLQALLQREDVR